MVKVGYKICQQRGNFIAYSPCFKGCGSLSSPEANLFDP